MDENKLFTFIFKWILWSIIFSVVFFGKPWIFSENIRYYFDDLKEQHKKTIERRNKV